jgi:hypothetical protein
LAITSIKFNDVGLLPRRHDKLTLKPDTKPISQEQLVAEVKGIYTRLVIVESKCIKVGNNAAKPAKGKDEAT